MLSMKSMQNRLDHLYQNAQTDMDDAQLAASESGDIEDLHAFSEASKTVQAATAMINESLRAKHSITKSILDGIQ
ncbi:type III secretion protein HrpF [Pseudomonas sp. GL-B-16]|uniref:type III secretion protein HrpF n=1 Tax=Pseudomonas sp. GL-B-16 TaxID=2832373 RepID=UPI001CBD0587|nr:type III secretion protein HrpF [Pseudomonas sp. GL-B-16]